MNDIFSLQRFGWLMRKILTERTTQILGTIGLSISITFILYTLARLMQDVSVAQNASFVLGLTLGGSLVASIVFGYFGNNATGASFLTLPASILEKWLSGILIVGGIYFFIFLLCFRLIHLAFVLQYHNSLNPSLAFYKEQYDAVHIFSFTGFVASTTYLLLFNFSGLIMLGALFFNKAAFVKTAFIICGIMVGAFLFNFLVVKLLIKNTQIAIPFNIVWIQVGDERTALALSPQNAEKIIFIFRFVLPAI